METTATETIEITGPAVDAEAPPSVAGLGGLDGFAGALALAPPCAGALDELVCERLSAGGRLDAVVAWERLVRHAHAGLMRALAAFDRVEGAGAQTGLVEAEVGAALAWPPVTAQNRLEDARVLTGIFPATLEQLGRGRVSVEQARSLVDLTGGLADASARAVEARVLPRMPGQSRSLTRQAIRRAVTRQDPQAAAKRHTRQRTRRRVELIPQDDGMATLTFYLPADVAQMAMGTLTELAQRAKRKNKDRRDKRTLDQRRADLLAVVLQHAASGGQFAAGAAPSVPARVSVVVGIETLLGLSHEPGQLEGYGPLCPEQTRRIAQAHAARWRFLLTAADGTVVHASARTYTPRAAVRRLTELTFRTCVFPHCRMPSQRCDLDHALAFHKGGPTTPGNLAPLCRQHHIAKSREHWQLQRQPDQSIHWTSALTGRSYTTAPTRYQPTPTDE